MADPKYVGTTFLHSVKINQLKQGGNAVVVSEILHFSDGSTRPNLRRINRPKRSFWVTKPQYRTHTEKRVIEEEKYLDKYTIEDSQMDMEIFRALNGYYPRGRLNASTLFESPYLYGANIDIQTLIKAHTIKGRETAGIDMAIPTTGFLDIERSIDPATMDDITVITVTHENKVYTAINKHFFYVEEGGRTRPYTLEELNQLSHDTLDPLVEKMFKENKYLKPHLKKIPFEFNYFVGGELECIEWIFARIHENKTSFIGIWNMDYDIPAILKAIHKYGKDPKDVICHPSLPDDYRYLKYKRDEAKVAHPADKWHWFTAAGYTQFYDAMCLYSKLRTVKGKEASYALDYILTSNGIEGKLKFPELNEGEKLSKEEWHRWMTRKHFPHYIVYNQADVVWIQLMEWLNTDAVSMCMLSGVSALEKFPRQTKKVQDTLFTDWVSKGWILGTTGRDMTSEIDDEIGAVGGAVLSPNLMMDCGLRCIEEYPTFTTYITAMCNDVDFSSMYPTTEMAGNIGTDTKLCTVVTISSPVVQERYSPSDAVEMFFGYATSPYDNALALGTEIFGLPGLDEMDQMFINR